MMRCALVHDWLTGMRGGEKVLELLCDIFPDADLYTMVHVPGSVSPIIERRRIVTSWLNRLPFAGVGYRSLLPLMPAAAERMRVSNYDLVVATSHCVAHGVAVSPEKTRFVCYCLTPMRYAWGMLPAYVARRRWDPRMQLLRRLQPRLQRWDRRAAARVPEYVAACENVRQRIRDCYGRGAAVIYPPVDTDFFRPLGNARRDGYLWVGALAPYKRVDLLLGAFRRLNRPVTVIGAGQDLAWARGNAPPNVKFLGWQPDEVLREQYANCRAMIFPGEEDFGLAAVEAQACGRPVIAYAKGGALETVVNLDGAPAAPTGVLFHEPTAEALARAVLQFERAEHAFDPGAIRNHALKFDRRRSRDALRNYLLRGAVDRTSKLPAVLEKPCGRCSHCSAQAFPSDLWSDCPLPIQRSPRTSSAAPAPVLPIVGWKAAAKRALDLIGSLVLLGILGLPMLLIALWIRIVSGPPALFRQERVGIGGRRFVMLKFRTMRNDAEERTGPVWAHANDPRCTRCGALIRAANLDELPQLFNVLRGEMSLVGPRPERPFFVRRFVSEWPLYAQRHAAKGGLTGWAQIQGLRGRTCPEARLQHDLHYIRNWSLGLDLRILLRTPWAMVAERYARRNGHGG
jgi:lipopolysaccharide/colanic/teichoic acid biosynthesis glycosyltransferase/glycosyltransferase involved in cell wall biosynthesis